jgi:hypothetical protein
VQRISRQLPCVPLGRRETADCLIDGVYIDQSSLENQRAIGHFGDSRRGCTSSAASLGVEGDRGDSAVLNEE